MRYIFCPFDQKDLAKSYGAMWDANRKSWYIPDHLDPEMFEQWLEPAKPAVQTDVEGQEDIPEEEVLLAPRNLAYYLSQYFDYEIRDRDVNTLLYELGYQEPQRGNPSWVATAKGEPISYMAMFANAKGSGYHLKWNKLEVWDIFTQHQEAKNIKAKLAYEERRFQQEQQAAKEEHEAKVRQMERECAAKLYRPPVELEHFSLRRNG